MSDFHGAIGRFINYRYALEDLEPERKLYLAISMTTYEGVLFVALSNLSLNVPKLA
jgi:hypothetical protein